MVLFRWLLELYGNFFSATEVPAKCHSKVQILGQLQWCPSVFPIDPLHFCYLEQKLG